MPSYGIHTMFGLSYVELRKSQIITRQVLPLTPTPKKLKLSRSGVLLKNEVLERKETVTSFRVINTYRHTNPHLCHVDIDMGAGMVWACFCFNTGPFSLY